MNVSAKKVFVFKKTRETFEVLCLNRQEDKRSSAEQQGSRKKADKIALGAVASLMKHRFAERICQW